MLGAAAVAGRGGARPYCGGGRGAGAAAREEASMARVIDADTHVSESTSMWEHLDPAMYPRRPVVVTGPTDTSYGGRQPFWLIDGNILPRPGGTGAVRLSPPPAEATAPARPDQ